MDALHHFAHQPLGAELENLVGHVDLVDQVVEAVKARGGRLVRRVLDDDGGRAEIDERGLCVLVPRDAAADDDGQQEPFPLRSEVGEQVYDVDALVALVVSVFSGLHNGFNNSGFLI